MIFSNGGKNFYISHELQTEGKGKGEKDIIKLGDNGVLLFFFSLPSLLSSRSFLLREYQVMC